MPDDSDRHAPLEDVPSKSARKRHMLSLQALGESLLELSDKQLAQLPIDDEQLLTAIRECRAIHSRGARKRHLQLIGKLMRKVDADPIAQALEHLHAGHRHDTGVFHQLERLRADILARGIDGVELALTRYPEADRQQLRQLVLQHEREVRSNKPPAAFRKLFSYLKSLQQARDATG